MQIIGSEGKQENTFCRLLVGDIDISMRYPPRIYMGEIGCYSNCNEECGKNNTLH